MLGLYAHCWLCVSWSVDEVRVVGLLDGCLFVRLWTLSTVINRMTFQQLVNYE